MQKVHLACARAISRITEAKAIKPGSLFFVILAIVLSVSAILSIYAGRAGAAPNENINFQARLLTSSGALVSDGFYTVEFNIYNQASGGTTQWTETQAITTKNGYLTASLGSVTSFTGIDWSQEQWLSMNVNGDGEMSPRIKITAVPLAFRAVQADNLTTSGGTVTGDDLVQIAPGTAQSASSADSLLRLNQTGSGGLMQLQSNGVDILTLSNGGDLTIAQGLSLGASTNTTAGTLRWTGTDFEGYDGTQWISLTSGSGGTASPLALAVIQAYDSSGGTSLNTATPTAMPWDAETKKEAGFTHDNVTNNTRITMDEAGWYRVTYNISSQNQTNADSNIRCEARLNGTTIIAPSGSYSFGSRTNDPNSTNTASFYTETTAANEYVEILCAGSGSAATSTAIANESWIIAEKIVEPTTGGGSGTSFEQGGNSFGTTALLGTTDANSLNVITNSNTRLSIGSNGSVNINNDLTVGNSLTVTAGGLIVSAGGLNITGNSSLDGVLNLNSNGITNSGSITGVGNNITADGALTISSGSAADLSLNAASGTLLLDATTLQLNNAGTTALDLNDTSNTTLSLINSDGTAVAGLSVEGQISAQSFSGDGSALTSLNASNLSTGTVSDSLLSSNIVRLNTSQTFNAIQTLGAGLTLGNTANTSAGTLRWTGTDFEGYDGSQWVSLTGGGTSSGGAPVTATFYDSTGGATIASGAFSTINLDATLENSDASIVGLASDVITVTEAGYYEISYSVTSRLSSGTRSGFNAKLQLNTGSGFADVSGSQAYHYGRITSETQGTSSTTVVLNLSAGDSIRVQGQGTSQSFTTIADGTNLTITKVADAASGGGGSSSAFEQGGNDFGANAILGTTAADDLLLVTNGVTRLTIGSGGDITASNTLTVSGQLTANADVLFNANTVIGDASTDTLTINADSANTPNGLSFDGGTLAIEATNNRVGINNASPTNTLTINTPSANDASAEVLVTSATVASKALVLQAINGQTANILEAQNDSGNSLVAIASDGSLVLGNDNASPTTGQLVLNDASGANGFTGVLGISTLTASRSFSLPDASGTICLSGDATCGFVAFSPGSAQIDSGTNSSIFINKTGAGGNLLRLQSAGTDVFSVDNSGALTLSLDSSSAMRILTSSGIPVLTVDTNTGAVRIGNTTADGTGTLLVLDTKNTAGDPTGENGGIYYNSSDNKFRCFENNSWRDCIYEPFIKSYVDTIADGVATNNTTDYWDTSVENNNSYPNIITSTTSVSVLGMVSFETTLNNNKGFDITARVERGIGAVPTCGTGTVVGANPGNSHIDNGSIVTSTIQFIDNPNTTQAVYYTVCSDANSGGTAAQVTNIRVTLQEVNNQN